MSATLDDIAKRVGVSKTTVYRALNGKSRINEETRARILQASKELNYVRNTLASGLRSKRSMVIGIIFSDLIAGHYYSEIFHGIEDVATKNDYGVILGCSKGDIEKEKKLLLLFTERQVDGIIVAPTYGADINSYIKLKENKIPFVFIDKSIDNIAADIVTTDDVFGSMEAVNHLIGLGHKKIAVLIGPEYPCSTIERRIEGYRHSMSNSGLDYDRLIGIGDSGITNQKEYGYRAMLSYLDSDEPKATAVFAINDSLAIGAIKALRARGLKVPDDVAVIGCNNDDIDQYFDTQITTISQPKYEMGKKAMEILLERMKRENGTANVDNYQYVNMKPSLIIRQSCGAKR